MVNRTSDFVKLAGFGIVSRGIMHPVGESIRKVGQLVGLLPEIADGFNFRNTEKMIHSIDNRITLSENGFLTNLCFYNELESQLNNDSNKEIIDAIGFRPSRIRVNGLIGVSIGAVAEEFIFREFMQDYLLTQVPKYIIQKIAPGKESLLDSSVIKLARVILTAAAFSAAHIVNFDSMADEYVQNQLVYSFVYGIALGIIKESKLGLPGAIALHVSNNVLAMLPSFMKC